IGIRPQNDAINDVFKNDRDVLHKDPALWPTYLNSNALERKKYLDQGYLFFQNKNSNFNSLAFYVPCVGHSLNLVGECSVSECISAINFFGILQRLYAFFSASTHRWDILVKQKKIQANKFIQNSLVL
ncbi:hypothetical protein TSAR_016049, partial [Trichomalopsis sarcophagae]